MMLAVTMRASVRDVFAVACVDAALPPFAFGTFASGDLGADGFIAGDLMVLPVEWWLIVCLFILWLVLRFCDYSL